MGASAIGTEQKGSSQLDWMKFTNKSPSEIETIEHLNASRT